MEEELDPFREWPRRDPKEPPAWIKWPKLCKCGRHANPVFGTNNWCCIACLRSNAHTVWCDMRNEKIAKTKGLTKPEIPME